MEKSPAAVRTPYKLAAKRLMTAVEQACADGVMTPDVGGTANTQQVTDAVCNAIRGANI